MGNVREVGSWVIFEITVIFHNKINSDLRKFGEQVVTDFPQLPVISTGEGHGVLRHTEFGSSSLERLPQRTLRCWLMVK